MSYSTATLVGATGGAGATRLAVELGATLARDGRAVAVLDAAFATEGLARHVSGRVDPDLTKLLTEERTLDDGLREHSATADLDGRLDLCPVHAPFERLARAKTADAAQRFEALLDEAAEDYDHVLVDAPPVAANQAVAAATGADRVAVVAPASERGVDAVQRARGRVADVGASVDAVVANRVAADADWPDRDGDPDHPVRSADAAVPESAATDAESVPASAPDPEAGFAPAVARAAEVVLGVELDLAFEEPGLLDVEPDELLPDALS
ncbi:MULTISPECIES: AAA family ATPase [Halorussus]|uniref:AAA family ATPase n=1 Tax=Halorussus TaxID=1070314 RepID=UPI000E21128B|nr:MULTISPECIES: AAA family ATPase [Halorussus]NHN60775.1 CpsD/CapB family tyrosine-protein kinase [Halorussus sp. JP-T4]